jgi:hypothetical protein
MAGRAGRNLLAPRQTSPQYAASGRVRATRRPLTLSNPAIASFYWRPRVFDLGQDAHGLQGSWHSRLGFSAAARVRARARLKSWRRGLQDGRPAIGVTVDDRSWRAFCPRATDSFLAHSARTGSNLGTRAWGRTFALGSGSTNDRFRPTVIWAAFYYHAPPRRVLIFVFSGAPFFGHSRTRRCTHFVASERRRTQFKSAAGPLSTQRYRCCR